MPQWKSQALIGWTHIGNLQRLAKRLPLLRVALRQKAVAPTSQLGGKVPPPAERRTAANAWGDDRALPPVEREKAKLATTPIDATTSDSFDIAKYQDRYNDELGAILEAKVESREVVAPAGPSGCR
jgi:hypothetical protein